MQKLKSNFFETSLALLTLISIVGLLFYFYNLINSNAIIDNPFINFDNNGGIVCISIASFITRTTFIIGFLLSAQDKFRSSRKVLIIYLLSALLIGLLEWFELYYSSTFYYGEVRDKQGLMFPFTASLMSTLIILKINYVQNASRNLTFKLIFLGIINGGLILLWNYVKEPWNLWQS